jgi:hypothetical protein
VKFTLDLGVRPGNSETYGDKCCKSDLSTQYPVKTERPGDFATLKLTFLVIMPTFRFI